MNTPEKRIDAYLEDIRKKFLEKKVNPSTELSWGQFLDSQNQGGQVGLYGTLAAAISIKTRNANLSDEAKAVEQELLAYWNNRTHKDKHDNLCQNVRLAALLLGLSFHSEGHSPAIIEIAEELVSRFSKLDDLWGETSCPPPNAVHYSELSSAVIIFFSYQAIHQYNGSASDFRTLADRLMCAAKALQKAYLDDSKCARPHLLVMLIAIVLVLGKSADGSIRKRLSQEISNSENILQRSWFYVDYVAHSGVCKRDYFILPTKLLIPVLLLQPRIEGGHYLQAVNIVDRIKTVLDSNESKLFRDKTDRPSSLEQALAVLALDAFRKNSKPSAFTLAWPRTLLFLRKKRGPEWAFAWFFLIFAYLPVGLFVSAEGILNTIGPRLPAALQNLLAAAKLLPAWIPPTALLAFSAIRKPIDVAKAALGKGDR